MNFYWLFWKNDFCIFKVVIGVRKFLIGLGDFFDCMVRFISYDILLIMDFILLLDLIVVIFN